MDQDSQKNVDQLARKLDLLTPKTTRVFKNISPSKIKEVITKVNPHRIALDIASQVYQAYFVDDNNDMIYNFSIKLKNVDTLLSSLSKGTIVAFESCGASQHLGRYCQKLMLDPHIISAALVSGVRGSVDKSDAADAAAIYRTDVVLENEPDGYKKLVIIKTEEEQSLASFLARREDIMQQKVAQSQKLFALAREYGYDFLKALYLSPEEYIRSIIFADHGFSNYIADGVSDLAEGVVRSRSGETDPEIILAEKRLLVEKAFFKLPIQTAFTLALSRKALNCFSAYQEYLDAVEKLKDYNKTIELMAEEDERCKRLKEIPGVGSLSAVSLVATLGPAIKVLESPSAAAKYVGVVPAHTGTGGKTVFLGMSKQGIQTTKRILFQAGMSVVCSHVKKAKLGFTSWVLSLIDKGKNKRLVAGAISNKIVRTAFAILRDDSHYNADLDAHLVCHMP